MGKVLCDRADLVAIADAVRYKGGASGEITLGEMATGVVEIVPSVSDATATADEIFFK